MLEVFTEYNRLVKARYLLSYIDDPELRSHVQKALNRGEAYHQLRRAISQVNGDQFRGNSDEEIEPWNECARLMANAIIYFNSKVLSYLLQSFEHHGKAKGNHQASFAGRLAKHQSEGEVLVRSDG